MTQKIKIFAALILFLPGAIAGAADEVLQQAPVQLIERIHPRTGRAFQTIVPVNHSSASSLELVESKSYPRPDYRLLDHTLKEKIPYEGPYSSKKKIYIFAGTVATLGVVGGSLGMMSAAAATSAGGAAGGAAGFAAAGTAVGTGTLSTAWLKSRPDPEDQFERTSEARRIKIIKPVSQGEEGSDL